MVAWLAIAGIFALLFVAGCAQLDTAARTALQGWDTGSITVSGPFGINAKFELPKLPTTNEPAAGS